MRDGSVVIQSSRPSLLTHRTGMPIMPTLFVLITGILLTLGVSAATLAHRGDFAVSSATTIPALLQFDAAHGAATTIEAARQDRFEPASDDELSAHTQPRPDERQTATDEFQRYFDRHFRAHLALDASLHQRLEAH